MRDVDPRIWKRAEDAPARRCRRGAVAFDLVLVTRDHRPCFGDADLAACTLDRALDEKETVAVCVLPDRVCWMLDSWPGREALDCFRRQSGEYAEIYGAPLGRVWQRGFWYRPLHAAKEVSTRAAEIVRMAAEEGLIDRFGEWPASVHRVPVMPLTGAADHSSRASEVVSIHQKR